jgi:type I restriction enzyme R subunit
MPNCISEDDIEKATLQHLQHSYGYDVLDCYTEDANDLEDCSDRTGKVIRPKTFHRKT